MEKENILEIQTTEEKILNMMKEGEDGELFSVGECLDCGPLEEVIHALSSLLKGRIIEVNGDEDFAKLCLAEDYIKIDYRAEVMCGFFIEALQEKVLNHYLDKIKDELLYSDEG